jgi:hypothetical protein
MTFRRKADHAAAKAWKNWVSENQSDLEHLGLPLALYQDAGHWEDFLENGCLDWHSDGPPFDFRNLPRGQMEHLCAFLERHYSEKPPPLLGFLRARLGKDTAE